MNRLFPVIFIAAVLAGCTTIGSSPTEAPPHEKNTADTSAYLQELSSKMLELRSLIPVSAI